MKINLDKTKVMTIGGIRNQKVELNGQELEFVFLDSTMTETANSEREENIRIAKGTKLLRLKIIWRSKNLTMKTKLILLRSLVISIFLYACESCTLNKDL